MGGDGGCRVGEVRAGTTSPMPDHKGFNLQLQKFSTLRVKFCWLQIWNPCNMGVMSCFAQGGLCSLILWSLSRDSIYARHPPPASSPLKDVQTLLHIDYILSITLSFIKHLDSLAPSPTYAIILLKYLTVVCDFCEMLWKAYCDCVSPHAIRLQHKIREIR